MATKSEDVSTFVNTLLGVDKNSYIEGLSPEVPGQKVLWKVVKDAKGDDIVGWTTDFQMAKTSQNTGCEVWELVLDSKEDGVNKVKKLMQDTRARQLWGEWWPSEDAVTNTADPDAGWRGISFNLKEHINKEAPCDPQHAAAIGDLKGKDDPDPDPANKTGAGSSS